jgi:hypothetical protein
MNARPAIPAPGTVTLTLQCHETSAAGWKVSPDGDPAHAVLIDRDAASTAPPLNWPDCGANAIAVTLRRADAERLGLLPPLPVGAGPQQRAECDCDTPGICARDGCLAPRVTLPDQPHHAAPLADQFARLGRRMARDDLRDRLARWALFWAAALWTCLTVAATLWWTA